MCLPLQRWAGKLHRCGSQYGRGLSLAQPCGEVNGLDLLDCIGTTTIPYD